MRAYSAGLAFAFAPKDNSHNHNRDELYDVHLRPGDSLDQVRTVRLYATNPTQAIQIVNSAPKPLFNCLMLASQCREVFKDSISIIINGYASDSPEFSGCVETIINGAEILQIMNGQTPDCFIATTRLDEALPQISAAKPITREQAHDMWQAMPSALQENYLGYVKYIDLDRIKRLDFADGTRGYLMLGGAPQFLTLLQLAESGELLRTEYIRCNDITPLTEDLQTTDEQLH